MAKTQVTVHVAGQEFRLNGAESEEYILKVAQYTEDQINAIQEKYPSLSNGACVILAAINMADELMKLREQYAELDRRIDALRSIPQPSVPKPTVRSGKAAVSAPVKHPFEG